MVGKMRRSALCDAAVVVSHTVYVECIALRKGGRADTVPVEVDVVRERVFRRAGVGLW